MNSSTIGNVSNQAILCVNTFSQTHAEAAATREHYIVSDMIYSLCPNEANDAPGEATSVSPLWNTNFSLLPAMIQSPMSGLQQKIKQQKLQHQQQQHQEQMRMMITQMIYMNM